MVCIFYRRAYSSIYQSYQPKLILKELWGNPKYEIDNLEKYKVYEINCDNCDGNSYDQSWSVH